MKNDLRVIFFDEETSLIEYAGFSLWQDSIPISNVIRDWHIICVGYKLLGEKKTHLISVLQDPKRFKKDFNDDFYVVSELRKVLASADILVAHNGLRFDIKKFNARLIYHNLEPLPPIKFIDTLKEIKKIADITSNKLDYLGTFLKIGNKIHTGANLWMRVLRGEESAIKKMGVYCKNDVVLLEKVYLRIRKYIKSSPVNLYKLPQCPFCKMSSLYKKTHKVNAKGKISTQYQCKFCGKHITRYE